MKGIDFGYRQITVRGGKGNRDRITVLPAAAETRLRNHLEEIRRQHEDDLKRKGGYVKLPSALAGKYPGAAREWGWQWVFPSYRPYKENVSGYHYRHHLYETVLQKVLRDAAIFSFPTQAMPIRKSFNPNLVFSRKTRPIRPLFKIPLMALTLVSQTKRRKTI